VALSLSRPPSRRAGPSRGACFGQSGELHHDGKTFERLAWRCPGERCLTLAGEAGAQTTCEGAELVKPGVLTVAYDGDMPGTGTESDKLVGIDVEIMNWVAGRLGLTVEPQLMEWARSPSSGRAART
jgi:ABC-type amino acid transport substrate-binding protein